ncbi:MAG: hypothetical protein HY000_02120 [Planctomycetes bacterium]|nr:hypothetical protein [Planctomycetota bacterium]
MGRIIPTGDGWPAWQERMMQDGTESNHVGAEGKGNGAAWTNLRPRG